MHDLGEGTATPDAPDPEDLAPWDAPGPGETAADAPDVDAYVQARSPWFDGP
jgi:hypothetical protein